MNQPVDRTLTQIALSLYASTRTVEKLPKVTTYEPHMTVALVPTALTYRAGDYL